MRITRLHLILIITIAVTGAVLVYQARQESIRKQELQAAEMLKEADKKKALEVKNTDVEVKDNKEKSEKKQLLAIEAVAVAGEYWKLAKAEGKDISTGQAMLKKAKEDLIANDFESAWTLAHQAIKEFNDAKIVNKKVFYKVRHGDCLWKIAKMPRHYGNGKMWVKIWQANKKKIRKPRLIFPKQVFYIPHAHG